MPKPYGKTLFLVALFTASPVWADMKGPAEQPPASFKGQQYVDTKGCVFLRGGFGDKVTWVPRITKDRKQMCGYPPSGQRVAVAEEAGFVPTAAIAPPVVAPVEAKADVVAAPVTMPPAAPVAASEPKVKVAPKAPAPAKPPAPAKAAAAPAVAQPKMRVVCPPHAPLVKSFPIQGGGSQIMCTHEGQSLGQASPPFAPTQGNAPQGFETAWKDGRLNPLRGERSAEGRAQMEQLWTNQLPAQLRQGAQLAPQLVSPQQMPVASAPSGSLVQIGAFAVSANAEKVAARLAALGYPVSRGTAQGGRLQVIYAGPFTTGAKAHEAWTHLRSSGFKDAILRH